MTKPAYLATVPDTEKMTRELFINLMRKFRHHRSVKFGFSRKHTQDIMEYRRNTGSKVEQASLYNVPVAWDTDVTYVM